MPENADVVVLHPGADVVSSYYERLIAYSLRQAVPYVAQVMSVSATEGMVTIQRLEEEAPSELIAKAAGVSFEVGDWIVAIDIAGQPFAMFKIQNTAAPVLTFDGDILVWDDARVNKVIHLLQDWGVEVSQGRSMKGWSGNTGSGEAKFILDGSDGSASFLGGIDTLKFATYTDNSAVNGTNSSNADPKAINIETTIALGSGNWQVWALGIGSYYNATADTTVDQVMEIDGVEGALTNLRVGVRSSGYTAWGCEYDRTNRTGTIPIRILYKNNSASTTTTAGGGVILIRAMRTS